MYRSQHQDFACLTNMLDSIRKIDEFSHEYDNSDDLFDDAKSFDATLMNLIVIGEMADKLSESFITEHSEHIQWIHIRSLRNIIAHNYFGVDAEEIWQIITGPLRDLEIFIKNILS